MQIYGTKTVATIGPRKHITITYPAPRETLLGVPLELPTSEPLAPQVSFTVEAGDLPTLTGINAAGVTLSAFLIVGGQNLIQTGQNIYFEAFLNGVSFATPTGTSFSSLYTMQFSLKGVVLGDVLDVYLWTDNPAEVALDYYALALCVTQPRVAAAGTVLLNAVYSNFVQMPVLTLGSPDYNNPRNTNVNDGNNNVPIELVFDGLGIAAFAIDPGCHLFKIAIGDATNPQFFQDANERPFYNPDTVPTDIEFYPTSIRVV